MVKHYRKLQYNVAVGHQALDANTTGSEVTQQLDMRALTCGNTTGSSNIYVAVGSQAST